MKLNRWKHLLSAGCLVAVPLVAAAAPLQRQAVVGDPVWVLHVDVDALRQTVIGQHLLGELEKPEAQKKFAAFQAMFSFDPRKALHGLTLYGASKEQEDGVLLVYADFDAQRLTTLAEGAKEHESSRHRVYELHSWIEEKKPARDGVKARTHAAIHGGRIVVFAQKQERVAEALDVLDGIKSSLAASAQFPRLGAAGQPGFIQAAARKLELPSAKPEAAVFKQSKAVSLNIAESQRRLLGTLKLETDSEEVASQVTAIANGIVGLMALQKEKPDSVKLARALAVQQDGAEVSIKLSIPADDVVEIIKAKEARKAAEKAEAP